MAVHSFTTSAAQEAAITYKRGLVNQARAARTPPLPPFDDNASFVTFTVDNEILAPLVADYVVARLQLVANAYRTATTTQRDTVDRALGV